MQKLKYFCVSILVFCFLIVTNFNVLMSQTIPPGKKIRDNKFTQLDRLNRLSPSCHLITSDMKSSMWEQAKNMALFTKGSDRNNNIWELIGPNGIRSSQGINFICSGRIRDIEILNDSHIRVATASGGLWDIKTETGGKIIYQNISSEQVTSSWSGTVSTDPFDHNIILYGTGEPALRIGTGLWRTIDAGKNWSQINLPGGMNAFDEMEFTAKKGKVWCAGSNGVFYSDNSGVSWQQKRTGNYPGMVIYPENPDTIIVAEYDHGIFKTTNRGQSWRKLDNGLPKEGFSRIELANCKTQPNIIYALYTTKQNTTLGIYKTIDGGENWTRCTVIDANGIKDVDYHWGMAWYCSFISVSPTNPNHVISGGGWYIYSKDGQNFYGPEEGQHVDFHAGGWNQDGQTAWYANDGGVYATIFDEKWKWELKYNYLPITQFVGVAVSRTNPNVIIGGTQDNGLVYYNPVGNGWFYFLGDGGGAAIDPTNENKMFGTLGVFGEPLTFRNFRKFGPSAAGWLDNNAGIFPSAQWWRLIRTDFNNPPVLYTQADNKVYSSENEGLTWNQLNFGQISISDIHSMRISCGEFPKIYITGGGPDSSSCMVLDLSVYEWINITNGLPAKNYQNGLYSIPHVFTSFNPDLEDRVYVVMRGYGPQLDGKNVFRSDDKGQNWQNITSNLPNLPYTTLFEHPLNDRIIVVGTDGFGVYITENAGEAWSLWDTGLPKGAFITDVDYQQYGADSIFVVISTYGHGIWRRYIKADDMVNTLNYEHQKFNNSILQVHHSDNRFELRFKEKISGNYLVKCCNMNGRPVLEKHVFFNDEIITSIDSGSLPSGFYVLSMSCDGQLVGTIRCMVY